MRASLSILTPRPRWRRPLDFAEAAGDQRPMSVRAEEACAELRAETARQPAVPLWELVGIERGWWPPQDTPW